MNIIIYFLGVFSAYLSFLLSFPFYEHSYILLGSCLVVAVIQYIAHELMEDKKVFYIISIGLSIMCLVVSFSGLLYIKDVIFNKYMQESVYTFEILGKYDYYEDFFKIFVAMISITLPINTLYIYVFHQKKYVLSFLVLFPFIFVEVLFTITPPLYGTPYILYCLIAILSHHQKKIHIIPILLSICLMLSVYFCFSPTTFVHPRHREADVPQATVTVPVKSNQVYDLMKQGNRYYSQRVDLKIEGITNQSFLLKGNVYNSFNGEWLQTTTPHATSYLYLKNIRSLSDMFDCQIKNIKVIDNYHSDLVYTPYFYYSSSDTLNYFSSHFEGEKEEAFELIIPNQKWNDYLQLPNSNKYDILNEYDEYSIISLSSEIYDDNYPDQTYQTLVDFIEKYHLSEYDNYQDLIAKAKEAIFAETQYSLTPGITPSNEDFFDYFLNKNKKGYCVHYASTLALILRINGFNAHFVTGYKVDASNSYDDYTNVYDSSSHAWVEIEDPILGFVPIEATPASTYTTNPQQPNQTQTNNNDEDHQSQSPTTKNQDAQEEHYEIPDYIYYLGVIFLLILMIYIQSRVRYRQQWKGYNDNQIVCKMYVHLSRLHVSLDTEIMDLVKKAKFSSHQLTTEEYQQVSSYYYRVLHKMYHDSSFFYKIKLKIIDAYI